MIHAIAVQQAVVGHMMMTPIEAFNRRVKKSELMVPALQVLEGIRENAIQLKRGLHNSLFGWDFEEVSQKLYGNSSQISLNHDISCDETW